MSELDPAVPTGCPQSRYRALVTDPWVARCVTVACSGSKWLPTAATPRTRASTNLGVLSTESVLERNKFGAIAAHTGLSAERRVGPRRLGRRRAWRSVGAADRRRDRSA